MGKASRRKAERRRGNAEPELGDRMRKVRQIDERGRRTGTTLEAYEDICQHGTDRLVQTLIARHTKRMDRVRLVHDSQKLPIVDALAPAALLDIALYRHGASPRRPPSAYFGGWRDHLAWGVDSCIAAARLLLCGQVVGAATVARTQLERWTFHRASAAGLTQEPGEDTVDYIARVWTTDDSFTLSSFEHDVDTELAEPAKEFDEAELVHAHILKSDGEEICPPVLYEFLSELMHGRFLPEAIAWDSTGLLTRDAWPDDMWIAVGVITDTLTLCFRQLRLAAADLEEEAGRERGMAMLLALPDGFSEPNYDRSDGLEDRLAAVTDLRRASSEPPADGETPADEISKEESPPGAAEWRRERDHRRSPSAIMFTGLATPPFSSLMPLQPREGLHAAHTGEVVESARRFNEVLAGKRPEGRLYRDDELVRLAFSWHRARSIRTAELALSRERAMLGDEFDLDGLTGRGVGLVLASEAASISAGWLDRPAMSTAAYLIGSGLRSAYWLWLEDDDRAMSVLRCVLEQTARLRVWRLKPTKAAAFEASGARVSPRDWLEAAGWRRLRALNAALGEFAHAKPSSNWPGARDLLAQLQTDAEDETAILTARGAALDFVAELVAAEILACVEALSPLVGRVMTSGLAGAGIEIDRLNAEVEARFNHIWSQRTSRVSRAG